MLFGSAIPTKFGSLINEFSYNDFVLQLGLTFKFGYWFRRSSINYTNLFNSWTGNPDYALRWKAPGDENVTSVPVNQYTTDLNRDLFYSGSSVLVEKGDHIRLKYINLAYKLSPPIALKNRIGDLQLFFNASDLGILWKATKTDLDPDFIAGTHLLVTPKNFSLGLKVAF